MKKLNFYKYILIFCLSICVFSVSAAGLILFDSDRDEYAVGEFLGYEMGHQKYYVQYYKEASSRPDAEGFLYYDDFHESMKIVVFENNDYYGFTIEGHWTGSGSTIAYVNSIHDSGRMRLYVRGRASSAPERKAKTRVKHVSKE